MADDPSLRQTIEAAMADEESGAIEPVDGGALAADAAGAAPETLTGETGADGATEPKRDDGGKFAKADETAQIQTDTTAVPAEAAPSDERTSRPPHSLPAPLKAEWAELPEKWRSAFLSREDDVNTFRAQQQQKAERLNRFDEVISPHRQRLSLSGQDEVTWFRNLAAAEQVLLENPVGGLVYLARTYGADTRQLVAQLTGGQSGGMAPPTMDPALQSLLGEIQTLKQTVTQQQRSAEDTRNAELTAQITAFANDPAHMYFTDVKEGVAALLQSGQANTLKDAYDMACWANPEVRALLQKEQSAKASAADTEAQARAKATAAAQAAGSVTGSPGTGGSAGLATDPSNLRATLQAALDEQMGRV